MLVALGLYEFWRGHATDKITLAVAFEVALALAFLSAPAGGGKVVPQGASITPLKKRKSK
jgi:hypothetical protein